MKLSLRLKQLAELLVALVLPLGATFFVAQSNYDPQMADNQPSAEGRLGQYQNGVTPLYPGDNNTYPVYPGDNPPMYPGDEKWDGRYSYGLNAQTVAMASDGTSLFASMYDFNYSFASDQMRLMRFDGTDFHNVGWSLDATPQAIVASGNDIYVGGYDLTQAGGMPVNHVAHLNGTQTDNMGGGLSSTVYNFELRHLIKYGGSICAGGIFDKAGNQTVSNVACWNGTTWLPLSGGVNGTVTDLAVYGTNLYVSGYFTIAGSVPANSVAYWDGSAWHAMGNGFTDSVTALGFWQGTLYLGTGNGAPSPLMRWNGTQWESVSSPQGLAYSIGALTAGPDGLYVSGNFKGIHTTNSPYPLNFIARWDGTNWYNLGSGIDGATWEPYYASVYAVQPFSSRIFVGGKFYIAGNNGTSGLAAWNTQPEVENYQYNGSPIGPGSYVYLIGKYFAAYEPIRVMVNGVDIGTTLYANNDGKVFFHFWFPGFTQDGTYTVTLTGIYSPAAAKAASPNPASTTVIIQKGAPVFMTDYAGTVVHLPYTGSDFVLRVPMITR